MRSRLGRAAWRSSRRRSPHWPTRPSSCARGDRAARCDRAGDGGPPDAGGAAAKGAARRGARTSNGQRAPRGENRRLILAAIKDEAKTAGDVAKETGIGRPTVSTTLTKLVSDGVAVKAQRGYKAA